MRLTSISSSSRFGVLLLLAASSCGKQAGTAAPSASAPAKAPASPPAKLSTPVLDFAVEPMPGENVQILRCQYERTFVDLGPRRAFRLAGASVTSDATGYPALGFEIANENREEFRLWTAAHIGKRLGIFLDGRLTSASTIQAELPGSGVLEFGEKHRSRDEVQALVDRIVAASAHPNH
jgi:hypothetical protein